MGDRDTWIADAAKVLHDGEFGEHRGCVAYAPQDADCYLTDALSRRMAEALWPLLDAHVRRLSALRELIEDAPHEDCEAANPGSYGALADCTCWMADALRLLRQEAET